MRFIILLLVGFAVRAEIFIGPTSETNRLQIGTNETLVVSAWIGTGGGPLLPIVLNSVTNNFYVADTDGDDISYGIPLYFPGPAEIIFTNLVGFSFQRLHNFPIKSVTIVPQSTNQLTVPVNRTVHLLHSFSIGASGRPYELGASFVSVDGRTGGLGRLTRGAEFSGPATLYFVNSDPAVSVMIPYYFVEDSVILPEQRLLPAGSGNFEILVEKSADLIDWFPVVAHRTSAEQKQFYRLKLLR